jgi:nicotinamidase-related amidase
MNTLLIVDMQNAWLNRETPRLDKAGVIARINHAAQRTRAQGGKVIFVQHCDESSIEGSEDWQIDADLIVLEGDGKVNKTACDSFAETSLQTQLKACDTTTLIVCGLATEFCLDTTIRAAPSLGFNVVVLSDAHTTGDRPHMKASAIVEHHNWVWANMSVPGGRTLMVETTAQVFPA